MAEISQRGSGTYTPAVPLASGGLDNRAKIRDSQGVFQVPVKSRRVLKIKRLQLFTSHLLRYNYIVKTEENYSVKVYGTEFNVSAYKDDNYVETTLVSGSIELFAGNNSQKVKPGEKTIYDKRSCDLKVIKVNTEYDTAWKDGSIIFKNHTMEDVLKILGRHYNVRFVVKDQRVMSSVITGKFDYEQLPQLMEYLKIASGIKYEIKKPQIRDGIIIEKSVVEIYK